MELWKLCGKKGSYQWQKKPLRNLTIANPFVPQMRRLQADFGELDEPHFVVFSQREEQALVSMANMLIGPHSVGLLVQGLIMFDRAESGDHDLATNVFVPAIVNVPENPNQAADDPSAVRRLAVKFLK